MENLKIKVNSEAESKEAQELFFELGYEKGACSVGCYPAVIVAMPFGRYRTTPYSSRATSMDNEAHRYFKEITLPELHDLVVLKRNDVGDATHTDGHYSFYVGKDKNYFFSSCDKAWRGTWKNVEILKPIEKPMKEYLNKLTDGTYKLVVLSDVIDGHDGLIEIPEGAIKAYLNNSKTINFVNSDDDYMNHVTKGEWVDTHRGMHEKCGHVLVWQRHTQPEELPFVDDEPSLNDQYAEIEQVRKEYKLKNDMTVDDYIDSLCCEDTVNHPSHYASSSIECIDAMEAMLTTEQFIGYLRGNAFKYQWRYENKGGITDLEKAQWYLNKLISRIG